MRRFGRGQVRLRDERPDNWSEEDEARHRSARERWQLWVVFWIAGSVAAFLGGSTIALGSTLGLWGLAALLAVPFGIWTGPTLPDLVRRTNEDERRNNRIRLVVTALLCFVGTLAWYGALVWLNAVFDLGPRPVREFQVVSVVRSQGRAPIVRAVIRSEGREFIMSGSARLAQLKAGDEVQLPVGRGLFRVQWIDGSR